MATVTQPTPTRKPTPVRRGTCRWFDGPPDPDGNGLLLIEDTLYATSENRDKGALLGFNVRNLDSEKLYHIDLADWTCSCPDHTYRGAACKHARSLYAALERIGRLPPGTVNPFRRAEEASTAPDPFARAEAETECPF